MIIDGIEYAPVKPNGKRAVVVVDRGWVYAGDVTEENGRIYLDRAVWVFRWREVGFDGLIAAPEDERCEIRELSNRVDMPAGSEIFRIPVGDSWGL